MFKRKYTYYITFSINNGTGRVVITLDYKIKTQSHIVSIENYLKQTQSYDNPILLNWIKIKN